MTLTVSRHTRQVFCRTSLDWDLSNVLLMTACCSVAKLCPAFCDPHGLWHTRLPCPSLSQSLLKFTSIESVMLSNHLILCHPLLLPSVFPSIRVISDELALWIRWLKYRSFSFSLSNEYTRLISFRIDWFALLVAQRTLKRLLQHHSTKASVLWSSAFFMVQLAHLYMTTGKTIALTIWTLSAKLCLCFLICCLGWS